jgi:hypothetical protein
MHRGKVAEANESGTRNGTRRVMSSVKVETLNGCGV